MGITVSRDRVKAKAGVTGSNYDSAIDALIAEFVAATEPMLQPSALASNLVLPVLNLGVTEWIAGEFLAEQLRLPGAAEAVSVDGFELRPPTRDVTDPSGLKAQGLARLAPFWRDGMAQGGGGVLS